MFNYIINNLMHDNMNVVINFNQVVIRRMTFDICKSYLDFIPQQIRNTSHDNRQNYLSTNLIFFYLRKIWRKIKPEKFFLHSQILLHWIHKIREKRNLMTTTTEEKNLEHSKLQIEYITFPFTSIYIILPAYLSLYLSHQTQTSEKNQHFSFLHHPPIQWLQNSFDQCHESWRIMRAKKKHINFHLSIKKKTITFCDHWSLTIQ